MEGRGYISANGSITPLGEDIMHNERSELEKKGEATRRSEERERARRIRDVFGREKTKLPARVRFLYYITNIRPLSRAEASGLFQKLDNHDIAIVLYRLVNVSKAVEKRDNGLFYPTEKGSEAIRLFTPEELKGYGVDTALSSGALANKLLRAVAKRAAPGEILKQALSYGVQENDGKIDEYALVAAGMFKNPSMARVYMKNWGNFINEDGTINGAGRALVADAVSSYSI
jgi:hypothetical protein